MQNPLHTVPIADQGQLVFNLKLAQKEDWLTSEDVMALLNISSSTLYRYRKDGRIPYIKLGRVICYPKNLINKYLLQNSMLALKQGSAA
ncbi:helix-turn-helix domain-containing protein [Mangrovimonas sp. DI 80]|uniref:helix-turn-helix domain-containing protein n=1 Tax=Mangrovimonas sp. DI 80 TaxID=1779330 RepID=UPI00097891E9|nr:helix-turn-helix domain-containing protein [Mangrovimonas sp. DI 80]OMP32454.1 hypothetical protein BKM32_05260 [Mangrovimonas sp. DI 80]